MNIPYDEQEFRKQYHWRFETPLRKRWLFYGNCKNINTWLILFGVYDEFYQYYKEYLSDKDENVTLHRGPPNMENLIRTSSLLRTEATKMDIRVTIHILYLFMNKQPMNPEHSNKFIKARLKAVCATLHIYSSSLLLTHKALATFCNTMNLLPKLKTKLFWFCYNKSDKYKELELAKTLMANSGMTRISDIFVFINANNKTLAHSDPIMETEIQAFLETVGQKKQEAGAMWPYWRFIHPNDTSSIAVTPYPNLAVASVYYRQQISPDTCKNYMFKENVATISGLKKKVETTISISNTNNNNVVTDELRLAAGILGLNLERVITARNFTSN
ncbi:uncharacterized protein [Prorops nasuta]|uniref:uncharacterized protein n=1 Tax=Prorops nasuta TaxID=863751 RepID=UPI0034CEC8FF